jgi:hypothetical protein
VSFISSLTGGRLFGGGPLNPCEADQIQIVTEPLGREHAGKTGIRAMHYLVTRQGPLHSGLELSAQDPRVTPRWMNEAIATYRGLHQHGFTSTIEPTQLQYHLFEADRLRAIYSHRDSVGQLLTFTQEGANPRLLELFTKQQVHLTRADVLHVFISCPPDDQPQSIERLQNDLTILAPYVRAALNGRRSEHKLAVALILTKPDGAFETAEEAREALTNERLRAMLHRLVRLLEGSDSVGQAAIFVTSAFGYGKAQRVEQAPASNGAAPPKGFSLLSEGEPEWLLKEGEMPQPHNLTALVWWSIMAGLLLKKAGPRGAELARTAQMLRADLEAMQAWYVPLNCRPLR